MKIGWFGADVFHGGRAGGRTDKHDEANFCNFANAPNGCKVLDCAL